jgi:serine/threonine-protein kinase
VLGQNFGIVYLALSSAVSKEVVLKGWGRGLSNLGIDQWGQLVRVQHPNILLIYDVGEVAGHGYLAAEYFENAETLAGRLQAGPLEEAEARNLTVTVANGLQFVRNLGVATAGLTTGDIILVAGAPAKLWLEPPRSWHLRSGFMAPEEASGEHVGVTSATDVYRVGGLLYAMLTGSAPLALDSTSEEKWRREVAEIAPDAPRQFNSAVGRKLEAVCLKCLQKLPADRYRSLPELVAALT